MSETDAVVVDEAGQTALLDVTGKEFNAMWIDEKQSLFIPNNPLHFKTHKLQILLARLDKQAEKNPAQFNSTTYLAVLNEYTKCAKDINEGKDADDDTPEVVGLGDNETAPAMGERVAAGVDNGISADNPLSQ